MECEHALSLTGLAAGARGGRGPEATAFPDIPMAPSAVPRVQAQVQCDCRRNLLVQNPRGHPGLVSSLQRQPAQRKV